MNRNYSLKYFSPRFLDKWWNLIFIISFLAISFYFNYQNILFKRPQSVHVWRQTDCASMALNYYQYDYPLLAPRMHYQYGTDGKAVGEFPLMYYIVGWLYRVFGFHEFIFRLLWWGIALTGSYCFYRFSFELTGGYLASIVSGLILFTSPLMAYYSINFIADPAAIYISAMAMLALIKAHKYDKNGIFVLGVMIVLLAGLLKVYSLMTPVIIMGIYIAYLFFEKRQIKKGLIVFGGIAFIAIGIFTWYAYARHYNMVNGSSYFFLRTAPYWEMKDKQTQHVLDSTVVAQLSDYFDTNLLKFLAIVLVVYVVFGRGNSKKWVLLCFFALFLAEVFYILLFFKKLDYHDYYLLNIVPFFAVLYIGTVYGLYQEDQFRIWKYIVPVLSITILLSNIFLSDGLMKFRYGTDIYNYNPNYFSYNELTPYLRIIGIEPGDKVVSIRDESPNITLYLMNQKGWSNLYNKPMRGEDVKKYISLGAKYLIASPLGEEDELAIRDYLNNKIGEFEGISIYKLPGH